LLTGCLSISQASKPETKNNKEFIDANLFHLISDWWYMAILSLAETNNCKASSEWLAQRFNIGHDQAKDAVNTLLELGFIHESDGFLKASGKYLRFSYAVPDESIRKHHRQGLELARNLFGKEIFP
jgi:uncharacterized protein (TIGR02147 family)